MPQPNRSATKKMLRQGIAAIEQRGLPRGRSGVLPFGIPSIDKRLAYGGLRLGCVHEATGTGADSFVAVLTNRLPGTVLWCTNVNSASALYPPGLAALGVEPTQFILSRCRNRTHMLWAMEEGLRSGALAAVVAELDGFITLAAGRRLQLAAEAGCVTGFILPPNSQTKRMTPGTVFSAWHVDTLSALALRQRRMRWRATLTRCRGGGIGHWQIQWDAKTNRFSLVSGTGDGQAEPAERHLAGQASRHHR